MQTPSTVIIHPVGHPDPRVHRAGFQLDDPYLERCWREAAGSYGDRGSRRSIADVTDAASLGEVRSFKKAAKAAAAGTV